MRTRPTLYGGTLLAAILSTTLSAQRVLNVPGQYQTIQAAITAATPGDTVLVARGSYRENLDFLGKDITVKSALGPRATAIRPGFAGQVVRFVHGEGPKAVLEGFTITGGSARPEGGGIYCSYASPTLRRNFIENNDASADGGVCKGGGVYCIGGSPTFEGNVIRQNKATGANATNTTDAYGGGLYLENCTAVLVNNFIVDNQAVSGGSMFPSSFFGGGGLCANGGNVTVTNNTIARNSATGPMFMNRTGAGILIRGNGVVQVTNSIVWGNSGNPSFQDQIEGNALVSYSDIQGGYAGGNNISADPQFAWVYYFFAEYHLRFDSPCRDRGMATAPHLPALDVDGDPRNHGSGVDMGADEFHARVFYDGKAAPGYTYTVYIVGPAGKICVWGNSLYALNPPWTIPGINGLFYLDPTFVQLYPLGALPASGMISFKINLPYGVPVISVPMQALLDLDLTNVEMVHVVHW